MDTRRSVRSSVSARDLSNRPGRLSCLGSIQFATAFCLDLISRRRLSVYVSIARCTLFLTWVRVSESTSMAVNDRNSFSNDRNVITRCMLENVTFSISESDRARACSCAWWTCWCKGAAIA
eukprot:TRINITY_DN13248_c0_g1::TRINITY_DN13248_c0_g1_i1::g.12684::m.12684 TRINITY_DN13248_c0_g1::TRINITY_DN13248_c0_g1_i1::g.12684  ORF type:complete len:135 (+),score=7.22,DUF2644/PF10841.3/0.063 TRINITY_DN13248_c0_g1_i1:44-406(+)